MLNKIRNFLTKKRTVKSVLPAGFGTRRRGGARAQNHARGATAGGAKIPRGISGDGSYNYFDSKRMVVNARNAYHDSITARTIVNRDVFLTVDTGIRVRPSINASILGITQEAADLWNENTYERFHLYMKSKKCHRARKFTGYQGQTLWRKAKITDGDMYTRFFFEKEEDALSTVSFDFVDCLDIVGTGVLSTGSNVQSHDGINRDDKGRETSYNVRVYNKNGSYKYEEIPKERNNRTIMCHYYDFDQISQDRGLPEYSHALQEFQKITDFTIANIEKAIAQSGISIFIENEHSDPSNPFPEGDITTPAGTSAILDILGSETLSNDQKEELASIEQELIYDTIPEFSNKQDGSLAVVNGKRGDKMKEIKNTAPVTGYDKFIEAYVSHLTASCDMPMEIFLLKFNSNYTAARGALIMFYRIATIKRHAVDDGFTGPLYENWLWEEIATGRIVCPGWSDPILREAWIAHTVVGAPIPDIDPVKTVKAAKGKVELGATTLDEVSHEINGSDGKANRTALKRELAELVIPYWENGGSEGVASDKGDLLQQILEKLEE